MVDDDIMQSLTYEEKIETILSILATPVWRIGTPGDGTYILCFDWEDLSFTDKYEPTEIQELWLKKINGEDVVLPSKHEFTASNNYPCIVECDGEPIICVRGWGMLCSSYKLSEEKAAKIQDEFRDFIINRLNSL